MNISANWSLFIKTTIISVTVFSLILVILLINNLKNCKSTEWSRKLISFYQFNTPYYWRVPIEFDCITRLFQSQFVKVQHHSQTGKQKTKTAPASKFARGLLAMDTSLGSGGRGVRWVRHVSYGYCVVGFFFGCKSEAIFLHHSKWSELS